MLNKACPKCDTPVFAPVFWWPTNWRGRACKGCEATIKLQRPNPAAFLVLYLGGFFAVSRDEVPMALKILIGASVLVISGYLDMSRPVELVGDRTSGPQKD